MVVMGSLHQGKTYQIHNTEMTPSTLITSVEFVGIAQGLLLLVAWQRKSTRNSWPVRFLSLLVLTAVLLLSWLILHDTRLLAYVPDLISLGPALPFLFGPLVYGYVKVTTTPTFQWQSNYWLHTVPFWLIVLGHVAFYGQSYAVKHAFVLAHYHHAHLDWWGFIPVVQLVAYGPAIFRLIRQHNRTQKSKSIVFASLRLDWLRQLCWALALSEVLFVAVCLGWGLHPAGFELSLMMTGFVYLIGYRQLYQPQLFQIDSESSNLSAITTEIRKYSKSEIAPDQLRAWANQLEQIMQTQQRYRQAQLSSKDLADELAISVHQLSQVLNQCLGVSFYDYLNRYRVEAVQRDLNDARRDYLTILALAFEAGFDSKATFNQAFRKHTGLTPSQYRKQVRSANTRKTGDYQAN